MQTTPEQRKELEQLALAAIVADDVYLAVMHVRGRATPSEAWEKGATAGAFAAAMNPQLVSALLADLSTLETQVQEMSGLYIAHMPPEKVTYIPYDAEGKPMPERATTLAEHLRSHKPEVAAHEAAQEGSDADGR